MQAVRRTSAPLACRTSQESSDDHSLGGGGNVVAASECLADQGQQVDRLPDPLEEPLGRLPMCWSALQVKDNRQGLFDPVHLLDRQETDRLGEAA